MSACMESGTPGPAMEEEQRLPLRAAPRTARLAPPVSIINSRIAFSSWWS